MNWNKIPPNLQENDIVLFRYQYKNSKKWKVSAARVDNTFLDIIGSDEIFYIKNIGATLFAFEWGPVVYREKSNGA